MNENGTGQTHLTSSAQPTDQVPPTGVRTTPAAKTPTNEKGTLK